MTQLQGQLLIAAPSLRDPNFFHSVLLLIRHTEEGAFGLVLNREASATVDEIWAQISTEPCSCQSSLHVGGPIQGPLMALHGSASLGEIEVLPGVHFTSGRELLLQLVAQPDAQARYFVGYAGWGSGQLEGELEAGAWSLLPATPERVFHAEDQFWEAMTRLATDSRMLSALGIKHIPPDPRMN